MTRHSKTADGRIFRRGFTMIELLVVIGIVVLLLAILMPVVAQVRIKAYVAQTEAEMQRIMGGIQAYYHDHNAYPGPISEAALAGAPAGNATPLPSNYTGTPTSSENLVLGLLGFLAKRPDDPNPANPPAFLGVPQPPSGGQPYTPSDVSNLNPNHPKTFHYIDYVPEELTQTGFLADTLGIPHGNPYLTDVDPAATQQAGSDQPNKVGEPITDSQFPEFLDHIPTSSGSGMAILYMRARVGASTPASNPPANFIGASASETPAPQYYVTELAPYGFNGNNVSPVDFAPQQATANGSGGMTQVLATTPLQVYFQNPAIATQPRGKDAFILISAGADHLYGTKDDIIVTP